MTMFKKFLNFVRPFFTDSDSYASNKTNKTNYRRLQFESLETREMLSVSPFGFDDFGADANSQMIVAEADDPEEIEYNAHDKAIVQSQGLTASWQEIGGEYRLVGASGAAATVVGCSELRSLTSTATDTNAEGCSKLTSLSASGSVNVSSCSALTTLSISSESTVTITGIKSCPLQTLYVNAPVNNLDVSGITSLTNLKIDGVKNLNASGCTSLQDISNTSFTGVIKGLESLNLSGCSSLITLGVDSGQLTTINLSNCSSLTGVSISNSPLQSINLSGCTALPTVTISTSETIQSLNLTEGLLKSLTVNAPVNNLDVSGVTSLTTLYINKSLLYDNSCSVKKLNTSGCTSLTNLYIYDVKNLDASGCTSLQNIYNRSGLGTIDGLESLNLSGCSSLGYLNVGAGQLTTINLSNCSKLTSLTVTNNPNSPEIILSGCVALKSVSLTSCELKELDVSECTALTSLNCSNNELLFSTLKLPPQNISLTGTPQDTIKIAGTIVTDKISTFKVLSEEGAGGGTTNYFVERKNGNVWQSIAAANVAVGDTIRFRLTNTKYNGMTLYTTETKIVAVASPEDEQSTPQNYAVLFSGGIDINNNYPYYYDSIKDLYTTLTTTYGLLSENIYVLYADGTVNGINQSGNNKSDMRFVTEYQGENGEMKRNLFEATGTKLQEVLRKIGTKMQSDDHLLFYTFDHGKDYVGTNSGWGKPDNTGNEYLAGWGEDIRDSEVAGALSSIQQGYVTTVFAQCYSGGILDNVRDMYAGNSNVHFYGMAATNHYEKSLSNDFARQFNNALNSGFNTTDAAFAFTKYWDRFTCKDEIYPHNGGDVHYGDHFDTTNSSTWQANVEHPWSVGESFAIFAPICSGSQNGNRSVNPPGSNTNTRLSNSPISTNDTFDILTTDNVYLTYAVGNYGYEDSGVYAKYSWTGTTETLPAVRQNDVLEKTVSLGQFAAGEHTVTIELYDSKTNELVDTITRTFIVKTESTDPGDTISTAKIIALTNDKFSFTETIGNGLQTPKKDVDLYQLNVTASDVGKTFLINSSPTDDRTRYSVWSFLRLFDSNGTEIAHSEASDLFGIGDAFLLFTPSVAGTYYIGVSANNNTAYNSKTAGSGTEGNIGDYQFSVRRIADPKPDLSVFYQVSWYNPIISVTTQDDSLPGNNFRLGNDLSFNFSFANLGETTATGNTSRVTITGSNGYSFTRDFVTDTLAIGNIYTLPENVNLGKLEIGTYTISIELNIGNKTELTRENNTYQTTFEVLPPLDPPKNLRTTTTAKTTIVLDWNNVDEATEYVLERKTGSGEFETIGTVTDSKYVDTGLTAGTTYQYRVKAVGSEFSDTITVTTLADDPNVTDVPVITNTTVDSLNNAVTLTWTDLGSDYTYVLYKAGRVVVNFSSDNSYVDTRPPASGVEGYALMAFNKTTQKASSVTMSVVWTTAKPLEITGHEVSPDGKVTLLWDAEPGVNYNIFRAGRNISGQLTFSGNAGSWTDNNPQANNDYMLVAIYNDGTNYRSTFSNIYTFKKPTSSQASALNAFWAEYDGVMIDDDVLNAIMYTHCT